MRKHWATLSFKLGLCENTLVAKNQHWSVTFSRQARYSRNEKKLMQTFRSLKRMTELRISMPSNCQSNFETTLKAAADKRYNPGNVVILLSQSRKLPEQYFCACGTWNTSSYIKCTDQCDSIEWKFHVVIGHKLSKRKGGDRPCRFRRMSTVRMWSPGKSRLRYRRVLAYLNFSLSLRAITGLKP